MDDDTLCPLKFMHNKRIGTDEEENKKLFYCEQGSCAWWIVSKQVCAIYSIALSLAKEY